MRVFIPPDPDVGIQLVDATPAWDYDRVDWGDGTSDDYAPNRTHSYSEPGYYNIYFRRLRTHPSLRYVCYLDGDTPYDHIIDFFMDSRDTFHEDCVDPLLQDCAIRKVWINGPDWMGCNSPARLAQSIETLILPESMEDFSLTLMDPSEYYSDCKNIVLTNFEYPTYIDNSLFDFYPNASVFVPTAQFTQTLNSYPDIDDWLL